MKLTLAALAFLPVFAPQDDSAMERGHEILPLRERAAWIDAVRLKRLDTVVPALMRAEGIDMWILVAREYNEDPVVETMLPSGWMSARRRTILLFHDPGEGEDVERLAVARYDVGNLFPRAWDKEKQPDQWARLAEIVAERDPEKIALDVSPTFALADGLSHSEYGALVAALPGSLGGRIVSAEKLAIGWLETRIEEERAVYPTLCAIAHRIIGRGLSNEVIVPGKTTTHDVGWWYRERILALGLDAWFHPHVSVQRKRADASGDFSSRPGDEVIQRGDLVHVDFGITYLGLNTDTQQHAYVLREDETEPPDGLVRALARGNRVQDILRSHFATGRSGNEVLALTLAQGREEGLGPIIYTHPLGLHGHGAGPTIGLWDQQGGVPGRGDATLRPHTAWSIELSAAATIPEWGDQEIKIMLEEDAYFDGERVEWIDGRQTELLIVR